MAQREIEYLQGLLGEIERIKTNGGKALYRVNDKMSENTVKYIKSYFATAPEYNLEIRKCYQCTNTWDVIITF